MMVMEYCPYGSLNSWICMKRPVIDSTVAVSNFGGIRDAHLSKPFNAESLSLPLQMLTCAHQICRGMEYISSSEIIHCDLATRNVLVDWKCTMKIADFGMACECSTKTIKHNDVRLNETNTFLGRTLGDSGQPRNNAML